MNNNKELENYNEAGAVNQKYADYTFDRAKELERFKTFALSNMKFIRENGLAFSANDENNDGRNYLVEVGDARYSGSIIAAPINPREDTGPAVIINTVNDGFHFMGRENGKNYDMGKVDVPCVIGDGHHAHGLYIPLNNNTLDSLLLVFDELENESKEKEKLISSPEEFIDM